MKTLNPRPPSAIDDLSLRALAGVQRSAQNGALPLFAWTLGLPKSALLALLAEHHMSQITHLHRLTEDQYERLRQHAPVIFEPLVQRIKQQRSTHTNEHQAQWLARVLAAACLGERYLWRELGLNSRNDLSRLLERHFQPLYRRNQHGLHWKRFLCAELGVSLDAPHCGSGEQLSICFAADRTERP